MEKCPPRLRFELADLNRCLPSLCAFMYVNGGTCWLWPHFPLCLESLTGWVDVTLNFSLLEVRGFWAWRLVCWASLGTMYALNPLFSSEARLLTGVRKCGQLGCDGRTAITLSSSPSFFRLCGTSGCHMAPKGLGLFCGLMALALTQPPAFQEVPIVAKNKNRVCFGAFVSVCKCGLLVNVCLWKCMSSPWPVSGWSVPLSAENCWARAERNGETNFFLCEFEQFWLALHVPVCLASELGSGPCLFSSSHCLLFFFYTCFYKVTFLTHCIAVGPHLKKTHFSCLFECQLNIFVFWITVIWTLALKCVRWV